MRRAYRTGGPEHKRVRRAEGVKGERENVKGKTKEPTGVGDSALEGFVSSFL